MFSFFSDFMKCGILGWCLEILFTALHSLRKRDFSLKGSTSLWMFPIYGSIALLKPVFFSVRQMPVFFRGLFYSAFIFCGEFLTGSILQKNKCCPWNYSRHKWHIKGIIRLDYFPVWFLAGLLFEKVLRSTSSFSLKSNKK